MYFSYCIEYMHFLTAQLNRTLIKKIRRHEENSKNAQNIRKFKLFKGYFCI